VKSDRDFSAKQTRQLGGTTDVIEVSVGVEDHRRPKPRGPHAVVDLLRLLTGVDHDELTGIGITEKHAVCLDLTYRKNFKK
jgi:hypothetical protein